MYREPRYGQVVWSIEYDGLNVLDIASERANMTAMEIKNVILNEGGTIDKDGTIHRGSAAYMEYERDTSNALEAVGSDRIHANNAVISRGARIGKAYLDKSFMDAFFGDIVQEWQKQRAENGKELTAREVRKALENAGYYVTKQGIIKYNPRQAWNEGSNEWLERGSKLREKAQIATLSHNN